MIAGILDARRNGKNSGATLNHAASWFATAAKQTNFGSVPNPFESDSATRFACCTNRGGGDLLFEQARNFPFTGCPDGH
jgi:hypothetical protein